MPVQTKSRCECLCDQRKDRFSFSSPKEKGVRRVIRKVTRKTAPLPKIGVFIFVSTCALLSLFVLADLDVYDEELDKWLCHVTIRYREKKNLIIKFETKVDGEWNGYKIAFL